jgi:outer membrane protein OmpA-like peptidoglycan-associated protein
VNKAASGAYGSTSSTINVTFIPGPVSSTTSTVVANPSSVTNPGATTVTVTLEDQNGNPVDNQTVDLAGTGSALIVNSSVNTGASNVASFTVSDVATETSILSATDLSQASYSIGSVQVAFGAASSGGGGGGGGGGGAPLVITTSVLPDGTVGQPYGTTLTASGTAGSVAWSCSGLPAGLACSNAGAVSGIPSASGTFPVTVTISSNGQTVTVIIALTVTTVTTSSTGSINDVTAVAGDSDALVSFVAPSGTSQLTGVEYTVTAGPGGATCVTKMTSCLVSGLTNGTTYTFSVVMTSTSSPASSPTGLSNPATPTSAPILSGPTGVGVTTVTSPTKPLSPGSVSGTLLNGASANGTLSVTNSSIIARSDGVTMTITTASTISTTTGFTVVLVKNDAASVTGTGFFPGSVVDLYMFSPQIFLGSVVVKASGDYSKTVRIPANVPVGNDIVLSQGFVKSGARASVSVGIVVDASNAALLTLFPFATGLAALTPTMDRQLQSFALEVKSVGTKQIVFTGYTDVVGGAAYNLALGNRRALSAATYLRQALLLDGVTAQIRFVTLSEGSTAPSASNLTSAGRARNRNVTVFAILF